MSTSKPARPVIEVDGDALPFTPVPSTNLVHGFGYVYAHDLGEEPDRAPCDFYNPAELVGFVNPEARAITWKDVTHYHNDGTTTRTPFAVSSAWCEWTPAWVFREIHAPFAVVMSEIKEQAEKFHHRPYSLRSFETPPSLSGCPPCLDY